MSATRIPTGWKVQSTSFLGFTEDRRQLRAPPPGLTQGKLYSAGPLGIADVRSDCLLHGRQVRVLAAERAAVRRAHASIPFHSQAMQARGRPPHLIRVGGALIDFKESPKQCKTEQNESKSNQDGAKRLRINTDPSKYTIYSIYHTAFITYPIYSISIYCYSL